METDRRIGLDTAQELISTYLRAKDENRPHLMNCAFAESATLEVVAKPGAGQQKERKGC